MNQLSNLIVENTLEHIPGELDTGLIRVFLLILDDVLHALELHSECNGFLNIKQNVTFLCYCIVCAMYS